MEDSIIDQKISAIREVLCHVAGFPFRAKKDMSPLDYKAVELLTSELWEFKSGGSRLETYVQLYSIYGDDPVPEYVHRLAHVMTSRYFPVPGSETIQQAEKDSRPVETFGTKVGVARLSAILILGSFGLGWLVVLAAMIFN